MSAHLAHIARHAPAPPKPSGDCPTTTVTLTSYATTITKTLGIDSFPSETDASNSTFTSTAPTSTRTINLIPASGLITTHSHTTALNSTLTKPTLSSTTLHSATLSATPTPEAATDPSHQAGRVAGGVIGSLAGLALLVFLLAWCCKRKQRIKLKLRCARETKKEKEERRLKEERAKALQALEASGATSNGGKVDSPGLRFGFGGERQVGDAVTAPPLATEKPVPSVRYYAS